MPATLPSSPEASAEPPLSLHGRTVALAEGRQLEELAQMLEMEGAVALRCPLVSISDSPDGSRVIAWLRDVIAGKFTHIVLLTGEGLRRLLGFADREGIRQHFVTALERVRLVTRGPKPLQALKEIGIRPSIVAAVPTTEGVIAALRQESLAGAEIGIQFYCETNPPLTDFLHAAGAHAYPVVPYVYAPTADTARVVQLIDKMAGGQVDGLVFTSSPQVDRIFEVAEECHRTQALRTGLSRLKVAAVGPVVKERLMEKNVRVDVVPDQGFAMKSLVHHLKRALSR